MEGPGCFKAPNLHLEMQLLMFVINELYLKLMNLQTVIHLLPV